MEVDRYASIIVADSFSVVFNAIRRCSGTGPAKIVVIEECATPVAWVLDHRHEATNVGVGERLKK